ncbi:multiple monosaccharide ABC transporter ATP-binding protein [Carnobacteriaceae bacterium 52-44]
MPDYILEMRDIVKEFSGIKALNNVNLKIKRGEIHAICGENGAGKSTLMNVLSGVFPSNEFTGEIIINDEKKEFQNINDSEAEGITIIHQELALIPYLSIAENIFLGNENATYGIIDYDETYSRARNLMKIVGLNEEPQTLIKDIGVGKRQLVEIAKAISKDVEILILDEPTASLNEDDSQNLLKLLLEFQKQGITCIIISHKLNEVMAVSDSVTIIRDGITIETLNVEKDNVTEDKIIQGMVGRALENRYPERSPNVGEIHFEVKDWNVYHPTVSDKQVIHNIDFNVRKGEIVGIAGLVGAGRTEFAMSIFGESYGKNITGTLKKNNEIIENKTVKDAIDNGIAYVTEDRKDNGLVLINDINTNISMASLEKISNYSIIEKDKEINNSENYQEMLRIKTKDIFQPTQTLSGGNQQKVVLAKWLATDPDILFLDEPTRGIDVGAKYEIYNIMDDIVQQGKSIVLISSELPELLGMCDRIYTMNEGQLTTEIQIEEATQERLMEYMTKEV